MNNLGHTFVNEFKKELWNGKTIAELTSGSPIAFNFATGKQYHGITRMYMMMHPSRTGGYAPLHIAQKNGYELNRNKEHETIPYSYWQIKSRDTKEVVHVDNVHFFDYVNYEYKRFTDVAYSQDSYKTKGKGFPVKDKPKIWEMLRQETLKHYSPENNPEEALKAELCLAFLCNKFAVTNKGMGYEESYKYAECLKWITDTVKLTDAVEKHSCEIELEIAQKYHLVKSTSKQLEMLERYDDARTGKLKDVAVLQELQQYLTDAQKFKQSDIVKYCIDRLEEKGDEFSVSSVKISFIENGYDTAYPIITDTDLLPDNVLANLQCREGNVIFEFSSDRFYNTDTISLNDFMKMTQDDFKAKMSEMLISMTELDGYTYAQKHKEEPKTSQERNYPPEFEQYINQLYTSKKLLKLSNRICSLKGIGRHLWDDVYSEALMDLMKRAKKENYDIDKVDNFNLNFCVEEGIRRIFYNDLGISIGVFRFVKACNHYCDEHNINIEELTPDLFAREGIGKQINEDGTEKRGSISYGSVKDFIEVRDGRLQLKQMTQTIYAKNEEEEYIVTDTMGIATDNMENALRNTESALAIISLVNNPIVALYYLSECKNAPQFEKLYGISKKIVNKELTKTMEQLKKTFDEPDDMERVANFMQNHSNWKLKEQLTGNSVMMERIEAFEDKCMELGIELDEDYYPIPANNPMIEI